MGASRFLISVLLSVSVFGTALTLRRGETPNFPYDPNTTPYCTWWWDNDGSIVCADLADEFWTTTEDILRWNPSLTPTCGNYELGRSYCVEAFREPDPSDPVTTPPPTTTGTVTTPPPSTTSSAGNGIQTPRPIQPGMVNNCDEFHLVVEGDYCASIASQHGISVADLTAWNPGVGADCSTLWLDVHICVSIIGHSTTPPSPTSTPPPSGVVTPTPIQPGMVTNCDQFHLVQSGEICTAIVSSYDITLAQFVSWNPGVNADCSGLWAHVYVCVSTIGHTPTQPPASTTSPPSNGIETPTPIQPGMVDNCDAFYFAEPGQGCASIAAANGISLTQFVNWNPRVNRDCSGLWAGVYVCVSSTSHTPTPPTTPTNGVTTPTPTQTGMVENCDTFHLVQPGQNCAAISSMYSIRIADFVLWNSAVRSDCSGLWANTYSCVGLL